MHMSGEQFEHDITMATFCQVEVEAAYACIAYGSSPAGTDLTPLRVFDPTFFLHANS